MLVILYGIPDSVCMYIVMIMLLVEKNYPGQSCRYQCFEQSNVCFFFPSQRLYLVSPAGITEGGSLFSTCVRQANPDLVTYSE